MTRRLRCSHCEMRRKKNGSWGHYYNCPIYKSEVAREIRERRAVQGLCQCCGQVPQDGFKTCATQRARVRAAKRKAA